MEFLQSIDSTIWAAIIAGVFGLIYLYIGNRNPPQPSQSEGVQINSGGDTNVNAPVAGGDQTHVGDENKYEAPVAGRDVHIHHHTQTSSVEVKTSAFQSLHQIPPPDGDFIGRGKELQELLDKVKQSGVHISGIKGMGGIGKTQLAYKLVEELKPQYPDAQIYLDLKGVTEDDQIPLKPEEALAHVIRAFEPEIQLPEKIEELRPIFLSILDNKKAILLMDNALDEDQTIPLIPPKCSLLLVTSRKNFSLPGIHLMDLNTLPEEESIQLLLNISDRIEDHAKSMAELCGHLPLALNVAGRAMAVNLTLSSEEYIEELKRNEALEPVDRSLAASCKWLDEDQQSYFYRLCVFPGSFDSKAAGAVWELDEVEAKKTLNKLVNISLVEWDDEIKRYHLHDLTRVFARKQLKEQEHYATQKQHAEHFLEILAEANALYEKGGDALLAGLQLFDLEWENIRTGQACAAKHSATNEIATRMCNQYPDAGALIFTLRKNPREAIQWRKTALAASQKLKTRDLEGFHLGNLGVAYKDLGEYQKAIESHLKSLKISQEIEDKRNEGVTLSNLGIVYALLKDHEKAIGYLEQAVQIAQEISQKKDEGNALGNLGLVYSHLGKYQKAIGYYKQQLAIAQEFGDKQGEGNAYWNMSLAVNKLGDRAKAIKLAEDALEIYEAIRGPNSEKVRKVIEEWREEA